ncbi:MAG: AbrB/MazE/SpoVT family DNA-binding domain-containing protein [Tannerellaceae bacterium]|jgi:antitoxin MazE|nr:AbrB/MazE/SpoVT family DNA-binding domain-containing protein [Tannerellaceae bacterium]
MKTNIIQIGNSKGIIIPSNILRQLHLSIKSAVSISVDEEKIIIKSEPRQGWENAFKEFAESGSEESFFPDCFKDEDLSWWTWKEKKQ